MKLLTLEEIEEARIKLLENAQALTEEAKLLLSEGRYARAYSLAHLACEEMAKIPMIVRVGTALTLGLPVDWRKLDRRLRSHPEKITAVLFIDYLLDTNVEDDADIKRLQKELERISDYNDLKNRSLYTTVVDGVFFKPSESISPDLAEAILRVAGLRLRFFEEVERVTQGKIRQVVDGRTYKARLKLREMLENQHDA